MSDSTYEGWANWSTWNVNLWIDNDYGTYRAKMSFLRSGEPITAKSVEWFALSLFGSKGTEDMDDGDMADVDWAELAAAYENERTEDERYRGGV